jgi:hypothetical protein
VVPARFLRHPEYAGGAVFIGILGVGALGALLVKLRVLGLEGVGDVLQENQAEHDVLVFGRIHVVAQRVGGGPELGFEVPGRANHICLCDLRFLQCRLEIEAAEKIVYSRFGLALDSHESDRAASATSGGDNALVYERDPNRGVRSLVPAEQLAEASVARRALEPLERFDEAIPLILTNHASLSMHAFGSCQASTRSATHTHPNFASHRLIGSGWPVTGSL